MQVTPCVTDRRNGHVLRTQTVPLQVEDHDLRCLGYGGLHCSILFTSTPGTVDLVVPSQCVLLKEALETVLSKRKMKSVVSPRLKILSKVREELAVFWRSLPSQNLM